MIGNSFNVSAWLSEMSCLSSDHVAIINKCAASVNLNGTNGNWTRPEGGKSGNWTRPEGGKSGNWTRPEGGKSGNWTRPEGGKSGNWTRPEGGKIELMQRMQTAINCVIDAIGAWNKNGGVNGTGAVDPAVVESQIIKTANLTSDQMTNASASFYSCIASNNTSNNRSGDYSQPK